MPHSHSFPRDDRQRRRTGERYNDIEERGAFGDDDNDEVFGDYVNINDSVRFAQHLQNLPNGAVLSRVYTLPNGQRVREYDLRSKSPSLHNQSRQYTPDAESQVDEENFSRTRRGRQRGGVRISHQSEVLHLPVGRNSSRHRREESSEHSSHLRLSTPSPGPLGYSPSRSTRDMGQRSSGRNYRRRNSSPHVQRPRHMSREADDFDTLGSIGASVGRLLRSPSHSNGRSARGRGRRSPDPGPFERRYQGRYSYYQSPFNGFSPRSSPHSSPRSLSPVRNRYHSSHQYSTVVDSRDYLLLDDDHQPTSLPTSRPASSTNIESLPSKRITEDDKGEDGKASCPICIEETRVGTMVANMPCSHWFHFQCIKAWLEVKGTCPLCRTAYGTDEGQARIDRSHRRGD